MRRNTAPLVGLQQALCSHAAGTGGFYSRHPPVSSLQLGSYKHAVPPSRLAPTAGSLKGCLRGPLRHSFSGRPNRAAIRLWHHLTISAGKRSRGNFGAHRAGGPAVCALCQRVAPMGSDSPIAGRAGKKHFFFQIAAILFGSMWGLPSTPRASRGLRAPEPRGSGLVGTTRPHTPGFTFGRPKVNRKTAKTKVLDSFVLTSLYQIWNIPATEFRSFSNLQFGGQRYFGCRPVKGGHVSVGA